MFSNHFTTNFSQNAPVKKFWKSVNIWQRYGQNFVAYFLGHPVCVYTVVWWRYKGTWTSLSPVSSYCCYLFYLPSPLMPIDDGRQRKGQKSLKQYIHTYIQSPDIRACNCHKSQTTVKFSRIIDYVRQRQRWRL